MQLIDFLRIGLTFIRALIEILEDNMQRRKNV